MLIAVRFVVGVDTDDQNLFAKFRDELAASAAGSRQGFGGDSDCHDACFFTVLRDCLANRVAFSADAQPIRSIFNIATGNDCLAIG